MERDRTESYRGPEVAGAEYAVEPVKARSVLAGFDVNLVPWTEYAGHDPDAHVPFLLQKERRLVCWDSCEYELVTKVAISSDGVSLAPRSCWRVLMSQAQPRVRSEPPLSLCMRAHSE